MAQTMTAAALKRKISGGPLDYDFTKENRGLLVSASLDAKGHQTIYVVFQPYPVTQTSRHYELTDFKKRSKHEQDWLISGKLPA